MILRDQERGVQQEGIIFHPGHAFSGGVPSSGDDLRRWCRGRVNDLHYGEHEPGHERANLAR